MKRTCVATFALLALIAPASAADIYSTKDSQTPVAFNGVTWSGVYVSVGAGGVFTNANTGGQDTHYFGVGDTSLSGFLGDARLGYDHVVGGGWLIGVWGDLSYEKAKGSLNSVHLLPGVDLKGSSAEANFGYAAGMRVGHYFGTSLVYGLAGYQGQHVKSAAFSTDLSGGIFGGGIEVEIAPHWIVGTEVDYVAYADWHPATGLNVSADEVRATARLGYRF